MPEHLEDFEAHPWVQALFASPSYQLYVHKDRRAHPPLDRFTKNRLMAESLNNDRCIRTWQVLMSVLKGEGEEFLVVASVGEGLDGWDGVMHGGIVALLMDSVTAFMGNEIVRREFPNAQAVTRELRVGYKKAVRTPCVLLIRSAVVRWEGEGGERKKYLRMRGSVEDGMGTVFAESESLLARGGSGKTSKIGKVKGEGKSKL